MKSEKKILIQITIDEIKEVLQKIDTSKFDSKKFNTLTTALLNLKEINN